MTDEATIVHEQVIRWTRATTRVERDAIVRWAKGTGRITTFLNDLERVLDAKAVEWADATSRQAVAYEEEQSDDE